MTYMRSTFAPRELPEAIALRDEHIVFGPFCVHCGAPQAEHALRDSRCPARVSMLYPPPACTCHGVASR